MASAGSLAEVAESERPSRSTRPPEWGRIAGILFPPLAAALVIRPDGHVAGAGPDPAGLIPALTRWFGRPEPRCSAQRRRQALDVLPAHEQVRGDSYASLTHGAHHTCLLEIGDDRGRILPRTLERDDP